MVGICWQGSTAKIDKGRSFALSYFAWLLDDPRVQVVSLHKGVGEDQIPLLKDPTRLTTFGKEFDEGPDAFLDTAAVIKQCDLVISSDTAVAHLAGAMGVRTWVVLKKVPDWRWGYDGNTSAWYPNMQLFRQTELGNWSGAFDRVRHSFNEVLAGR